MTDILERLRQYQKVAYSGLDEEVFREAANEIGRLRGLMEEMLCCEGASMAHGTLVLMSPGLMRRIREALGDKT